MFGCSSVNHGMIPALFFLLVELVPSTTIQGSIVSKRELCSSKDLPVLRQRVWSARQQTLIRIRGGSDAISGMEEDEPADELSVMDDDDDDDDYELGRSLQSQQEPDAPEDELSAENSLEEEGSRALGHDSLSNPEEQEEAENSEEVLKRKLDKLITMTDKDVFDTYYEER
eukprot:750606-Hanusia_phi.AAC.2